MRLLRHRRLRRRGMQEQVVEEQHVPGLEDRPHDPRLSRRLLSHLLRDRPVEVRALLVRCREDAVEPPRNDVHAGSLVIAAVREREPDVERAHVAHEGAVLVPATSRVRIHLPQGALLHRDQGRLAEIAAYRGSAVRRARRPPASRREGAGSRRPRGLRRPGSSRERAPSRNRGVGSELGVVHAIRVLPGPQGSRPVPARIRLGLLTGSNARSISSARARAASRSTAPRMSRQPSRRIPARSTSGLSSAGLDAGEVAVSIREAVEGGLRVGRSCLGLVQLADPDGVPKLDELHLGIGVRALLVLSGERLELLDQLLGASAFGQLGSRSGSAVAVYLRDRKSIVA